MNAQAQGTTRRHRASATKSAQGDHAMLPFIDASPIRSTPMPNPVGRRRCAAVALFVGLTLGWHGWAAAAPLTIAVVSRTVFYVPAWLALREGYFKVEGIDARIEVFDNAEKIRDGLRDGSIQLALSTPEAIMIDAANGGSLRIVAGGARKLPHFIIAKPSMHSLAELKGARIGVLSMQEGTTYLVRAMMESAGIPAQDYVVDPVGGAPTRQRLLKEGKIDAGLQPFPLSYEAEAAGFSNLGPIAGYVPDWQFTSANVDGRWAEANPGLLTAALRALQRGQDAMVANPDLAASIAVQELRTTPDYARRALGDVERLGILDPGQSVSEPGLRRAYDALQTAGLVAADKPFALQGLVDESFLRQSRDITVRRVDSFMVGGQRAVVSGKPEQEVRYSNDAAPLRIDPNGTYEYGQAYAQSTMLAHPRMRFPILFLNGGTTTGMTWETTPAGQPGWQDYFLREGYNTVVTDAPGKGRAPWAPFPTVIASPPVFRPDAGSWTLFRMGPAFDDDPAKRQAFPGLQFDPTAFEALSKQIVPRFPGQDAVELAADEALAARVCPCIIVAHSSGAYFAAMLAARHPGWVKALVAVEMTAAPKLSPGEQAVLARIPMLLVWGDNQQASATWRSIRSSVDTFVAGAQAQGAAIDVLDLPKSGIGGNSHVLMMDRNQATIAHRVADWLASRHDSPVRKGP